MPLTIFGGGVNAFSRYENGKTKPPLALVKLLNGGGVGRYLEFVQAMLNPAHEEHIAMWRWCG